MGLAMSGLKHCEKCGKALNYDKCVLCKSCEKEKEGGQAMTPEQAQKILDELQEVRSEQLEGEARKLFEAIMKIADERDSLKIKKK